jgi:glycine cleavage system aminomethyltransferase T
MAIVKLCNSNAHDKHNTIREALGMFDMSEFKKFKGLFIKYCFSG